MLIEYRYDDGEASVSNINRPSIFLAGPTVRGNQPHLTSWRFEAVEEFKRQGFNGDLQKLIIALENKFNPSVDY